MIVKILGNGGAVNDGLPYNSFIINNRYLVETPPDIMNSIFREEIDISEIGYIFISHFHGDHYFGFPFLALRLFMNPTTHDERANITVIGPQFIRKKIIEICKLAVGSSHPLNSWINSEIKFIEINAGDTIMLDSELNMKIFPMSHYDETFGFSLCKNDNTLIMYFADTMWDDSLIPLIKLNPKVILSDAGGDERSAVKVHLTENDIINKAIPVSGDNTVYYATHLKYQKESIHERLKYTTPGMVIEID